MIELLGLLGGAIARLVPHVLEYFKEGRESKHELERMKLEIELEKQRGQNKEIEIARASAAQVDGQWAGGLLEAIRAQTVVTGDKWLDRVNISVRPVLTYWWCIVLYTTQKGTMLYLALSQGQPFEVVTEFDRAVIGSIVSFWFLDRSLRKDK